VPLPNTNRFFRVVLNSGQGATTVESDELQVAPFLDKANHTFCMSWSSIAGREYHIQAKQNLADAAWIAISPTLQATESVTSYCVPIDGAFAIFQVVEGPVTGGDPPARLMSSELIRLRDF